MLAFNFCFHSMHPFPCIYFQHQILCNLSRNWTIKVNVRASATAHQSTNLNVQIYAFLCKLAKNEQRKWTDRTTNEKSNFVLLMNAFKHSYRLKFCNWPIITHLSNGLRIAFNRLNAFRQVAKALHLASCPCIHSRWFGSLFVFLFVVEFQISDQ